MWATKGDHVVHADRRGTIVRILSTPIPPDAGELRVAGDHVVGDPNGVRAAVGFTPVTETLRGLLTGTQIGSHAIIAIAWSCGIAAASYPWALRPYRQRQPS